MICQFTVRVGANKNKRAPCNHKHCGTCERQSLPKRSSDFWVCCHCGELNPYNHKERSAAVIERIRRRTIHIDERYSECLWVVPDSVDFSDDTIE